MSDLATIHEETREALKDRSGFEKKLARAELQRFCLDRTKVNNNPWPRASNVRFPLSDTIIDQKKPFLYEVLHSAEHVASFKALVSANMEFSQGCEAYFDYHTRELTNFEREIQYALDNGLQDGETYVKVMWNPKKQRVVYLRIDPLFIITPANCEELEESPWVTHVIELDASTVLKRFKDVPDIEGFVKRNKGKSAESGDNEEREESRYEREGITSSHKNMIVLWERHYMDDDSNRRIITTSPTESVFDFKDDRAYPYEFADKFEEYMIFQYRREIVTKDLHSSRGIPELVQEGEFILTSAWRTWQNWATLAGNPCYEAPNGIPGNVQNLNLIPGKVHPFALRLVQQPPPPIDWQEQIAFTRGVYERRAATPDYGVGQGNANNDSRTATEVKQISGMQSLNVKLETGNWKAFMRKLFKASWGLIVQYKPESLTYFLNNELKTLPQDALNYDYQIVVSGSADAIDKEFLMNKTIALIKLNMGNQNANMSELTKYLFEIATPGQVQRFWMDTQQRQLTNMLKAADDVSIILSTGVEVQPQPTDDFMTNALTAFSILNNKAQTGQPLTPVQVQLVTGYIAANREALKKVNKEAYAQLSQQLNQADVQQHQKLAVAGQSQGAGQPSAPPSPLPGAASPQAMAA